MVPGKRLSAFLILAAAIYLFYSYKNQPEILSYNPSPESVLVDLQNELGVSVTLSEARASWKDKDSKISALKGHEINIGVSEKEFHKKINAFFIDKNFRKELENEFEEDEIYCTADYRADPDSYVIVFCGRLNHQI